MRTRKALRRRGTKQSFRNSYVKEFLASKRKGPPVEAGRASESEVELLSPTGRSATRPASRGE